jgi:hypothetical protein
MPSEPLIDRVERLLAPFLAGHGFTVAVGDDQANPFGAWVRLESDEFVIGVVRDRGQEWITVTSKVRTDPRAPRQGWPLGHIVAYLDGAPDPYPVRGLDVEAEWLTRSSRQILDSALLNSEGFRRWAVAASRRLFNRSLKSPGPRPPSP